MRYLFLTIVALAFSVGAGVCQPAPSDSPENNPKQSESANSAKNNESAPEPTAPSGAPKVSKDNTDWKNPNCQNPGNHDEADLCEQMRMAIAAEKTVNLGVIQTVIGTLGAIFVILTIYYSRAAAKAAQDAAGYANETLRSERAWVILNSTVIAHNATTIDGTGADLGRSINISFSWQNSGRSPAINVAAFCEIKVSDARNAIPKFAELTTPEGRGFLGQNDSMSAGGMTILERDFEDFLLQRKTIFAKTCVFYRSIFDKDQSRETCATVRIDLFSTTGPNGKDGRPITPWFNARFTLVGDDQRVT